MSDGIKWPRGLCLLMVGILFLSCDLLFPGGGQGSSTPAQSPHPDNARSALGVNLGNINYYQSDYPFVNLAKAGAWRTIAWGSIPRTGLTESGYLPVGTEGQFMVISGTKAYPWPAFISLV